MSRAMDLTAGAGATPRLHAMTPVHVQRIALAVFVALGVFVLLTFRQYGISNDEEVQHTYGRMLLDFYMSGFADRSAFAYKNLYLYGGLFDLIAAGLERVVTMNVWDLRHLLSAGFGLLGLAGTWLLARRLIGERAALIALALLALTGAWSGAMFTHTKDVPFAAMMVWALYFTTRFAMRLPDVRATDVAGLGVAIGCAFGLRVGAAFALLYLAATVLAAAWLCGHDLRSRASMLCNTTFRLLPAAALALALMGVFWPWAMMSSGNFLRAMEAFSHFAFDLDTILDGVVMKIDKIPGTYLLTYLLVRLPELFLLGTALAVMGGLRVLPQLAASHDGRTTALKWLPVVLAAGIPLAYTLIAAPPLYNGIRHFTFLLPPLAVIAAAGLQNAWRLTLRWPNARYVALGGCMVLAVLHLGTLVVLHPYEYLAYNDLIGGAHGAGGRWEQDYWASSLREATGLLNAYVGAGEPLSHPYTVAACAEPVQAAAWLAPGLTMTTDWLAADFFVSPTQMNCHMAVKGRIVAQVVRDGVTIAVVRDRRTLNVAARPPTLPVSP